MNIRGWIAVLLVVAGLLAGSLSAANAIWDGSADLSWQTAANWSTNAVPTAADTAVFDGSVALPSALTFDGSVQPGGIQVDNTSIGALILNITLTGNMTLAGNGGWAIRVGENDSLIFLAASARTVTVQEDSTLNAGANTILNTNSNVTLVFDTAGVVFTVGDGADVLLNATLRVTADIEFDADNSGGGTTLAFQDIEVGANSDFEWDISGTADVDVTINGDIRATGASAYFGMYTLLTGGSEVFNVTMVGDFDANGNTLFEIETDFGFWTFSATSHSFITGVAGTFEFAYFGMIDVPAGATLTVPDAAFDEASNIRIGLYQLDVVGTLDLSDTEIEFYGEVNGNDAVMINIDATAVFTTTGEIYLYTPSASTQMITGDVTFNGLITVDSNSSTALLVVGLGSTLTVNGDVYVDTGTLGADEDGGTASGNATLNFNGNFTADDAGSVLLGEGIFNFMGDIDLGATSATGDVVVAANPANDFLFQINLTNTLGSPTQTVSIDVNSGSLFAVTSVVPESRIVATGNIHLMFLDVSAATGAGVVWDGDTACSYVFGDDAIGTFTIVTGELDVQMGSIQHDQVTGASAGQRANYTFTSTGAGEFTINSITAEGDQDATVGDALNGAFIYIVDCTVTFTNNIQLYDGGTNGRGAYLNIDNSIVSCNGLTVGNNSGSNNTEGSDVNATGSTLLIRASLTVNPFGQIIFNQCLIDSGDDLAYDITMSATARGASFVETTITCDAAADVTLLVGGAALSIVNCLIEDYDASGLEIIAATQLNGFSNNTFQNGVAAGSHITLNGLANATTLDCDNNLFDLSTGVATDSWITTTGTNMLNFRTAGDFGLGVLAVNAALAETYDDDGVTAADVTWEESLDSLILGIAASQPIALISDSVTRQALFNFDLTASGSAATVTQMQLQLLFGGNLISTDIQNITIFEDADADGAYDSGEELGAGTLDEAHTGGASVLTFPNTVIASGTTVTWTVAVTFSAGGAGVTGTLGVHFSVTTGITITEIATAVIEGLPLQSLDVDVTGPVAQIVVITGPSDEQEDTAIAPAIVVEIRDLDGNVVLGRATNLTVSIQGGGTAGAVLGGTLTVAVNVSNGRATFSDLTIDRAGAAYILRFTAGAVFVDGGAITITAAPASPKKKGGGGGCATTDSDGGFAALTALLLLLALSSVAGVARLRRE